MGGGDLIQTYVAHAMAPNAGVLAKLHSSLSPQNTSRGGQYMDHSKTMGRAKNVIWIIVDSVRNYHSDADDRGRLAIMDEVAEHSIEFTTAVTSAPSTVMSTSAMMTGVPAVFHSRTYMDFDYGKSDIRSLPLILQEEGYNIYCTIFFPDGRQYLGPMMGNICQDCWPEHANPTEFWSNDLINEILLELLEQGLKEPFFLYLNYNCRHDPQTSEKVGQGLRQLHENDLFADSVFVLNSDHGYPDPSRQISFVRRREQGHDLIMTDDNVLTPLFISYPGCAPKKVTGMVSLLDITPTILDLLGKGCLFSVNGFPLHGRSLLGAIDGPADSDRIVRIDNRYVFQSHRTAALRNDRYKYVYSYDNGAEEFYDLERDSLEMKNLACEGNGHIAVDTFRKKFWEIEKTILDYHERFLFLGLKRLLGADDKVLALNGDTHDLFLKMVCCQVASLGVEEVILLTSSRKRHEALGKLQFNSPVLIRFALLDSSLPNIVDLGLVVLTDKNSIRSYKLRKRLERLPIKRLKFVNYNLTVQLRPRFWLTSLVKVVAMMLQKVRRHPSEGLLDICIMIKRNILR